VNLGMQQTTGSIMADPDSATTCFCPGRSPPSHDSSSTIPDIDVVYGHRVLIDDHDREIGRWILPAA